MALGLSKYDLKEWGDALAANDWVWNTWEAIFFDISVIALWVLFVSQFAMCFTSNGRAFLSSLNPSKSVDCGSLAIGYFFFAETVFMFVHACLFGPGPTGYLLATTLDTRTLANLNEFTYKYLSLAGLFFAH